MAEAEEVALEFVKEGTLKTGDVFLKLGNRAAKTLMDLSLQAGIKFKDVLRDRLNTGEMSVKRLYRVSEGNLVQTPVNPKELSSIVEQMHKQGINFAVEHDETGKYFLHFKGDDNQHVQHIIKQSVAKLGLKYEDEIDRANTTIIEDPSLADTQEFTAVQKVQEEELPPSFDPQEHAQQHEKTSHDEVHEKVNRKHSEPASDDYVPTAEEAEYLEAAGLKPEEQGRDKEVGDASHAAEHHQAEQERHPHTTQEYSNPSSDEYVPSKEEAEYLEAAGLSQQPTEAERLAATNETNIPEHIEFTKDTSTRTDSGTDAEGHPHEDLDGQDRGDSLDPQRDNVTESHAETKTKTVKGKTERTTSIRERLKSEISNRVKKKQAEAKHQQPTRERTPRPRTSRSK